ncbi:hypothetical protein [Actinokineospora pegani]|uniref:hypothetical protein n=1 Tax=Actinokineospora pegani TaxID=2654637 RepID=UPI0012EA012D|nr:hypothetical protein [Actinokineospora pegani]
MPITSSDDFTFGSIGDSMAKFAQAANAGQFAVNESGGQALISAIDRMLDWLENKSFDLGLLEQEPPLGSSHAAQVMKPYMQNVAIDHQGFLTQLRALKESLTVAREAIQTAMSNYQQTDSTAASGFIERGPQG